MRNRPKTHVLAVMMLFCFALTATAREDLQVYLGLGVVGQTKIMYPSWKRNVPISETFLRASWSYFNLDIGSRIIIYEHPESTYFSSGSPIESDQMNVSFLGNARLSRDIVIFAEDNSYSDSRISIGLEASFGSFINSSVDKRKLPNGAIEKNYDNWFGIGPCLNVNAYIPKTTIHVFTSAGMTFVSHKEESYLMPVLSGGITTFFIIWDEGFVAPKFW